MIWVKLTSLQYIDESGVQVTRYPGDWIQVGKSTALLWLEQGLAEIPQNTLYKHLSIENAGVLVSHSYNNATQHLRAYQGKLLFSEGQFDLKYKYNLLWSPDVPLRLDLLPIGFNLLDKWQVICPLYKYDILACHVGSEVQRERVKEIIRDLRVPLYDDRMVFVQKDAETLELIDLWKEHAESMDSRLALLCALYQVKPLLLALPTTWNHPNEKG